MDKRSIPTTRACGATQCLPSASATNPCDRGARMKRQDHRERGAVLIVALLFLVMLTLLGVTAMTGTTMEERMSGNARDASIAFQAAEAALRDARRDLSSYPTGDGKAHPVRKLPANWALNALNFGDNLISGTCNPAGEFRGLCKPSDYNGGQ